MADSTFGPTRPCCVYGGLTVFIWRHSRLKEASPWDAHLIITRAGASKRRSALQSALKTLSLRLLRLSLEPPLSVSLLLIPSFIPPLSLSLSPPLFSNAQACYVSCHSTHLHSRVNENKIPELFFFFLSSSLHFFHRSLLLSICSADERRLWSLSAGV